MKLADVFDQQPAIDWLRAAWRGKRLPHALIFAGPAGVGKATTATALASIFLCRKPRDDDPCGKCDSCRAMQAGVHPDFVVVYRQLVRLDKEAAKAKELAADVIRQFLIAAANLKPSLGHGKVFVVEEAELMSATAQNALLKTLEEPPGASLIILLTDQPDGLLPTIRSRCQRLRFGFLQPQRVKDEIQRRGHDKRAAEDAARFAEGSLGVALKWLEDGVIERARELVAQLDAITSGRPASETQEWLRKSADSYAERQLARDPLASKDQATREGLTTWLLIASEHLRKRLSSLEEADEIERTCAAIDALARAGQYLESNVNISLVIQQVVMTIERTFAAQAV